MASPIAALHSGAARRPSIFVRDAAPTQSEQLEAHIMNTSWNRRTAAAAMLLGLFALGSVALAAGNKNHHDGKQLVAAKLKTDGRHEIHQKGKFHTSVDVKGGKIAALHVRHETRGEIPVKKYKTHRKMADNGRAHLIYADFRLAQNQDLGTEYVAYAYVDDEGNEEYYWFPVEMILDGDTGAIEYVPES
jgi:hypothetical protein